MSDGAGASKSLGSSILGPMGFSKENAKTVISRTRAKDAHRYDGVGIYVVTINLGIIFTY
jgi:hypothetical protein